MVCPAIVKTVELGREGPVPTTKLPEGAKLTGVSAMVASGPPGVRTMPAIETADGSEIVNNWPATVTVGNSGAGSAFEAWVSQAPFGFAVGSNFPSALKMSAPMPEVFSSPSDLPPIKTVVGRSFGCGSS